MFLILIMEQRGHEPGNLVGGEKLPQFRAFGWLKLQGSFPPGGVNLCEHFLDLAESEGFH